MIITTPLFNLAASISPAIFAPMRILMVGGEAANVVAMKTILDAGRPEHLINAGLQNAVSIASLMKSLWQT
jgi:hypothetical protein